LSDVEGAFAGGAVLVAQVHYVDMHEADLVVLEGAVRFPGLLGGRHSVEALRPEDALDGVPAQVRQEGVDDEGQCIEGEAGGAAERAHDGTLLIAGPLEPLMRPGRAILTGIGAALAPFADGLHEDAVALGQHPGDFGRADDLGADNGVVRAWGWRRASPSPPGSTAAHIGEPPSVGFDRPTGHPNDAPQPYSCP
jgi:hypothetical protein